MSAAARASRTHQQISAKRASSLKSDYSDSLLIIRQTHPSMDDIPIDPALLAESSQQGAARSYIPPSDIDDDPLVELEAGIPEADDGDSSAFDDDSDDAYVDSDDDQGGKKRKAAKPLERKEDDAVFR